MKLIFLERSFLTLRLVLALLASIALMTVDYRTKTLDDTRSVLSVATFPVLYLVDLPSRITGAMSKTFSSHVTLEGELEKLQTENLLLRTQLQKLDSLQVENMRLRGLLDSSFKLSDRVFVAELLAVDLDPYKHEVTIDKGEYSGVFPGQPVLDANGIMGQVVHVGPLSSIVMLITDPSHGLPVQVNRNGLRTVAVGTGQSNRLDLPYLPNNADVQAGDLLVTSGLGGYFPAGYPVARVVGMEQDPGRPFASIHATPTARLERSREVLLIHRQSTLTQEDIDASLPADPPPVEEP